MISFEYAGHRGNGETLELYDNTSFSLQMDSPLFSQDAIAGTKVYNFSVPNSPKNRKMLEFVSVLPVVPRAIELSPVSMYLGNQLYRVGRLVIRDTSQDSTQLSFHTDAGALASIFNSLKLSQLNLGSYDLSYDHPLVYPDRAYALPVLNNPDFYGTAGQSSANPDFCEFINYYNNGNPANTQKNLHTLVPMPFLLHILQAVEKVSGYALSGSWLSEADTKRLITYNITSLDQKSYLLNLYQKRFDLSNHVPDITVGQMLVDLKNMFGLAISVEPAANLIFVRKLSEVINSSYYRDMTRQAGKQYKKSLSEYTGYTLKMTPDSADDLFRNVEYDWMSYQIDQGNEEISTRASTLVVEEVQDTLNIVRKMTVPKVSQKGNSPAFGLSGKCASLRLLYYNGMQPDNLGSLMPSASFQTARQSLHWDGATGLYEKNYKRWLEASKQSFTVENEMLFSLNDLMTLDMTEKLMIEGQKYLIESIRLGIRKTDTKLRPASVTLRHIPF